MVTTTETTSRCSALPGTENPARAVRGDGRRAHRRRVVLAAARDVFVVNGYHGARMEEISARAGISKPVLYSHFSGKLDLYLAVLQEYLDRMVDSVRAAVSADTVARTRVSSAGTVYFDRHRLDVGRPIPKQQAVDITVGMCWGGLSTYETAL